MDFLITPNTILAIVRVVEVLVEYFFFDLILKLSFFN